MIAFLREKLIFSRFRRFETEMSINQKTAKINMLFGHRFGVVLGWVLQGFGETKNLNFGYNFEEKSKTKTHDVVEGPKKPSRRRKKQSPQGCRNGRETMETKFSVKLPAGGGRGGITKNQYTGYLTRQWAKGPANFLLLGGGGGWVT